MKKNSNVQMESVYEILGHVTVIMTVAVVTSQMKKAVLVRKSIKYTMFFRMFKLDNWIRYDLCTTFSLSEQICDGYLQRSRHTTYC